ncbi:hypothetical protein WJX72_002457 [[Myrmecia] bisecta]|uniref:Nnf1 n=1 Tax=[Myrmecia] bisecta TaxID=41462 RepID=A0AAW1Q3L5_9CHLO
MVEATSTTHQQGRRLHALREGLHRYLKTTLRPEAFEEFQVSFQSMPEPCHPALYDLYKQVLHLIRANTEAEFENIVEEAQLWSKLNTLEQMCEEQGITEDGAVSGPVLPMVQPTATARSCRVQAKQQELDHLKQMLAEVERSNAELVSTLEAKRAEVVQTAAKFTPVVSELSKVHDASRQWAYRSSLCTTTNLAS